MPASSCINEESTTDISESRDYQYMTESRFSLPFAGGYVTVVEREGMLSDVTLSNVPVKSAAPPKVLAAEMKRYLAGEKISFHQFTVDYSGYTDFQKAVLRATRRIPYGETKTYGEIAAAAGKPGAARAVGQVMASNRTCIVIPCHRVVAVDGLGGFTGSLELKKALLRLEGSMDRFESD